MSRPRTAHWPALDEPAPVKPAPVEPAPPPPAPAELAPPPSAPAELAPPPRIAAINNNNLADFTKEKNAKSKKQEQNTNATADEENEKEGNPELEKYNHRVKRIFVVSLTFKICMLILAACTLGFAAESTPNIDIFDCNYDHRPGFVAFFIVVHAFFFCIMIFLMAYQLFYKLKEKAKVPQRLMDLFVLTLLIIVNSISLACYCLWYDDTLVPYYDDCQKKPLPAKQCITLQSCDMFESMKIMAAGAIFFAALLILFLCIGSFLLCHIIRKKMMESPEGRAIYRKMQEDSNLKVEAQNENENHSNRNNNGENGSEEVEGISVNEFEDKAFGYGGEGLVLLNSTER